LNEIDVLEEKQKMFMVANRGFPKPKTRKSVKITWLLDWPVGIDCVFPSNEN
jgi:hypothetical protein